MAQPVIAVDFDGTIHSYERGWDDGSIYGTVLPGFWEWALAATRVARVEVFSTRSSTLAGRTAMMRFLVREYDRWSGADNARPRDCPPLHLVVRKPRAVVSIDDRAVRFEGSWTEGDLDPDVLLHMRPWNERKESTAMITSPETSAEDVNAEHCLHTVRDESGHKMMEKLFKTYVRETGLHARMPAFMIACDRLLGGMGGSPVEDDTDDPVETDDEDDGEDQAEDIHEERSADADAERVRAAVASMLRRSGA